MSRPEIQVAINNVAVNVDVYSGSDESIITSADYRRKFSKYCLQSCYRSFKNFDGSTIKIQVSLPFLPFMINATYGDSVFNYDSEYNYDNLIKRASCNKKKVGVLLI